jgi:hypothetical protein
MSWQVDPEAKFIIDGKRLNHILGCLRSIDGVREALQQGGTEERFLNQLKSSTDGVYSAATNLPRQEADAD